MELSKPRSSSSKLQTLQHDLHGLCSGSHGEAALKYFVSEASGLLKLDVETREPAAFECSMEEFDYLISLAESEKASSANNASSSSSAVVSEQPIDPKFFSSLRRIVSDKEGDKVLMKGLQSLPYVKNNITRSGNNRDRMKMNSRKYEEDLSSDELSADLSKFVTQIVDKGDLKAYLVLLKVILCLWEDLDSSRGSIIDDFSVKLTPAILNKLQRNECIGKGELEQKIEEMRKQKRLKLFEVLPRIQIYQGTPTKLSRFEAQGNVQGFLGGVCIKPFSGACYFEVTVNCPKKEKKNSKIRIGWAMCGSECVNTNTDDNGALGDTDDCWVFEGSSGFTYNNAKTARLCLKEKEDVIDKIEITPPPIEEKEEIKESLESENASDEIQPDNLPPIPSPREEEPSAGETALASGGVRYNDPDKPQYSWGHSTTVGCYLNSNSGQMRFFVGGVEYDKFDGAVPFLMSSKFMDVERGVQPVFSCSSELSTVHFNVGQEPFRHKPVFDESEGGEKVANLLDATHQRSSYLRLSKSVPVLPNPKEENIEDKDKELKNTPSSSSSGIIFAKKFSDKLNGFAVEVGFRFNEDGYFVETSKPRKARTKASHAAGPRDDDMKCLMSCLSSANNVGFAIYLDNHGKIIFKADGADAIASPSKSVTLGQWHHLSVVYGSRVNSSSENQRNVYIYIDGQVIKTADISKAKQRVDKIAVDRVCIGGKISIVGGNSRSKSTDKDSSNKKEDKNKDKSADVQAAGGSGLSKRAKGDKGKDKKDKDKSISASKDIGDVAKDKEAKDSEKANKPPIELKVRSSFLGDICDFRFWTSPQGDKALCGRSTVTGIENSLFMSIPFEEGYGELLHDVSLSSKAVRLTNTPNDDGSNSIYSWEEIRADENSTQTFIVRPSDETKNQASLLSRFGINEINENENSEAEGLDDTSSESEIEITIFQLITAVLQKASTNLDHYFDGTSTTAPSDVWYRTVQDMFASTSFIKSPGILNFLVFHSCFHQIIRMTDTQSSEKTYKLKGNHLSAEGKIILQAMPGLLLRLLHLNINSVALGKASPASFGLQYSRLPEFSNKTFLSKLLVLLLHYVSAGNSLCREISAKIIICGLDIFYPHASDQTFLLECLFTKKFRSIAHLRDTAKLSESFMNALDIVSTKENSFPADPFEALLLVSDHGNAFILNTIMRHLAIPMNAAKLVPIELCPKMEKPAASASTFGSQSSGGSESSESTPFLGQPRPGYRVERGQDWCYHEQDGGAGSLGVIIEVCAWEKNSPITCLRVLWNNGKINRYRWNLVDKPSGKRIFDVNILKSPNSAENCRKSSGLPYAGERWGEPSSPREDSFRRFASAGASDSENNNSNNNVEHKPLVLQFTPEEVHQSLIEEVGELTKRSVLAYMQKEAPSSWQQSRKLTWSLNALVNSLGSQDTVDLYKAFYSTFSSKERQEPNIYQDFSKSDVSDIQTGQLSNVLSLLIKDIEPSSSSKSGASTGVVDIDNNAYRNDYKEFSVSLLCVLQGLLTGVFSPPGDITDKFRFKSRKEISVTSSVKDIDFSMSKLDCKFPVGNGSDNDKEPVFWDWENFIWKTELKSCAATAESDINYLSDSMFDPTCLPTSVMKLIGTQGIEKSDGRDWATAFIDTKMEPNSGIYSWYVKISGNSNSFKCDVAVGVSTSKDVCNSLVGKTAWPSWGFTTKKDFFAEGVKVREMNEVRELKLGNGTVLELIMDTDKGIFSFRNVTPDAEHRDVVVAFEGLEGKTLYPAVSLLKRGDSLAIVRHNDYQSPSNEDSFLLQASVKSSQPAQSFGAAPTRPPGRPGNHRGRKAAPGEPGASEILNSNGELSSSSAQAQAPLGAPSQLVVQYCIELLSNITSMLGNSENGFDGAREVLTNSFICRCAIHLLSTMCRWEFMPSNLSKEFCFSLNKFLSLLSQLKVNFSQETAVKMVKDDTKNNNNKNTKNSNTKANADITTAENIANKVLNQFICVVSSVVGRLACSWIVNDTLHDVDNRLFIEELSISTYEDKNTIQNSSDKRTLNDWLSSPLLVKGLVEPDVKMQFSNPPLSPGEINNWLRSPDYIFQWISKYDRTSNGEKGLGGADMQQSVKLSFCVNLLHTGYMRAVMQMSIRLNKDLGSLPEESPPFFIMSAWEAAMKCRIEARKIRQFGGSDYRIINRHFVERLNFLISVVPVSVERKFDFDSNVKDLSCLCNKPAHWNTSFIQSMRNEMTAITKQIREFTISVGSSSTVPLLKAAMKSASTYAEARKDGFQALRVGLENVSSLGAAPKCAILMDFPSSMRNNRMSNYTSSINDRSSYERGFVMANLINIPNQVAGHYFYGLEGGLRKSKQALLGAFEELISYLTEQLRGVSNEALNEDNSLLLCLMNCLGLRILEEDHAMVSRLQVFQVIQEILEFSVSSDSIGNGNGTVLIPIADADTTDVTVVQSISDRGVKNESLAAAGSKSVQAMMKLFFLLTLQVAASKESVLDGDDLEAELLPPKLVRANTGPATLGKAVFDILYSHLLNLCKSFQKSFENQNILKKSTTSISATSTSSSASAEADKDNKNDKNDKVFIPFDPKLELKQLEITEDISVVLTEACTLLHCLSGNKACQVVMVRPKWIALLLRMLYSSPDFCREKSLLILIDVLPLMSTNEIDSSASLFSDIFDSMPSELFNDADSISKKIVKSLLRLCGKLIDVDISRADLLVVTPGTDISFIFGVGSIAVVSEAVALVRTIMHNKEWASTVETCIVDILSPDHAFSEGALISSKTSSVAGALSVTGGHLDSLYTNCHVIQGDNASETFVVACMREDNDNLELYSVGESEGYENAYSTRMPIDTVKPVNRFPSDNVQVSEDLMHSLFLFSEAIMLHSSSAGSHHNQPGNYIMSAINCICGRTISNMVKSPASLDRLISVLLKCRENNYIIKLLNSAVVSIKAGGLLDIPVYEKYLTLLFKQYRISIAQASITEAANKRSPKKEEGTKGDKTAAGGEKEKGGAKSANPSPAPAPPSFSVGGFGARAAHVPPSFGAGASMAHTQPGGGGGGFGAVVRRPEGGGRIRNEPRRSEIRIRTAEQQQAEMDEMENDEGMLEAINNLESMGFPRRWCTIALMMTGGDSEEALNYILSSDGNLDNLPPGQPFPAAGHDEEDEESYAESPFDEDEDEDEDDEDEVEEEREEQEREMLARSRPARFSTHPPPSSDNERAPSMASPKDCFYDERRSTFLPIFADPSSRSALLGGLFPGDPVSVVEEQIIDGQMWLKINAADYVNGGDGEDDQLMEYNEGLGEEGEEEEGEGGMFGVYGDVYAWIEKSVDGVEVVRTGKS